MRAVWDSPAQEATPQPVRGWEGREDAWTALSKGRWAPLAEWIDETPIGGDDQMFDGFGVD